MAKNKEDEKKYKSEGIRRAYLRLADRTYEWRKRGERGGGKKENGKECPDCGGRMSWCTVCYVWSQYCCTDYGTCACS